MAFLNRIRKYFPVTGSLTPAVWLLFSALLLPSLSHAQEQDHAAEYKIKAAYLYKFCDYVEWPKAAFPSPDSPLVIGVLGADDLATDLEQIAVGRDINGRSITVKRLQPGDPINGMQVLFIGRSAEADLAATLDAAQTQSILTVTEQDDDGTLESIINFIVSDDRVRFDVKLDSARRNNLQISSRLLSVARRVREGTS